jgi:hypothetical protein
LIGRSRRLGARDTEDRPSGRRSTGPPGRSDLVTVVSNERGEPRCPSDARCPGRGRRRRWGACSRARIVGGASGQHARSDRGKRPPRPPSGPASFGSDDTIRHWHFPAGGRSRRRSRRLPELPAAGSRASARVDSHGADRASHEAGGDGQNSMDERDLQRAGHARRRDSADSLEKLNHTNSRVSVSSESRFACGRFSRCVRSRRSGRRWCSRAGFCGPRWSAVVSDVGRWPRNIYGGSSYDRRSTDWYPLRDRLNEVVTLERRALSLDPDPAGSARR